MFIDIALSTPVSNNIKDHEIKKNNRKYTQTLLFQQKVYSRQEISSIVLTNTQLNTPLVLV